MWKRDGKPFAFVSQPYADADSVRDFLPDLYRFAIEHGLEVHVSGTESWWNPPSTVLVMITRAGERDTTEWKHWNH